MTHILIKEECILNTSDVNLVIVDGIDGCGKTTICKYISDEIQAIYYKALGEGPIGQLIRKKILAKEFTHDSYTELTWMLASVLETIDDYVLPTLRRGTSVVLDRFLSSTYAYQISRNNHLQHSQYTYYINILQNILKKLPAPLFIYCDVTIENSNKRIAARNVENTRFDEEKNERKLLVQQGFDHFFEMGYMKNRVRLDCNVPLLDVFKQIDHILEERNQYRLELDLA